ncbi:MAG: PQQ-like beta-propeller repeat protein [Prolixibacteraceae bacterium]|jgi:outer membrane protein assembly factor BamB|nr:PQQ-like beta-propeller repeat protein [Prolixibacteraceae bacterium]MBT6764386.1 PQQ-like beta-propeller repeat protein [Prolixibacteraceae bacterium]MBT6999420.1 PQQ-like beta-propeller repeat protein [Prolixibacteraceae bacterium]MBT7394314.1 PQQ-like beta-propeller repeat protein [Prolixibacteraceae bacterium]
MFKVIFLFFISIIVFSGSSQKSEFSDWRGPNRNGIYEETNLLKSWPDEGPELIWSFEDLGFGHSAVAIANEKVYVTGIKDSTASVGTLFTFDFEGNLLWEKDYGKDFTLNFPGTRAAPVIVDDLIYIESGMGAVYCLSSKNGDEIWSVDFIMDLGVDSVIQFGYAESVLVNGENLICVPGGKENNVVALNRFSGEIVWSSEGFQEPATYNSPILINRNGQNLVIAMTSGSIMGIDSNTGEMYWRVEQTQQNKIHANTPIYSDGKLVVSSADPTEKSGLVQLELSEDGKNAEVVWRNKKFRNLMGGLVKIDSCIYGSAYMKNDWQVIDWNTGEMLVQNKDLSGGSIIYADGLFYCYAERDGEIALVDAAPDKFEIIDRFKVLLGTKEHWARPVIDNGILYVRHGDALMAYSISSKN